MPDLFNMLLIVAVAAAVLYWAVHTGKLQSSVAHLTASNPVAGATVGAALAQYDATVTAEIAKLRADLAALNAPKAVPSLAAVYIDRDDFMKAIGAAGYAGAVSLDGKLVHNGGGAPVAYFTQPGGQIAMTAPAANP